MDIEAMGIEFVKMIIPEIILAVLPLPLKFLKNRNLWFAKLRDWKNRKRTISSTLTNICRSHG